MEILITGCERSGTKMLSKILGDNTQYLSTEKMYNNLIKTNYIKK